MLIGILLVRRGYKEKVVREFVGGNALRVLGLPPIKLYHLKSNIRCHYGISQIYNYTLHFKLF